MPTTRLRVLAPAALLVLTAAACGSGDTDAEGSASTSGTTKSGTTSGTTTSTESAPPPLTGEEVHWGYTGDIGPAQWASLSPDFAACEDGRTQSPIDLTPGTASATEHLDLDYGDVDEHLVDNGHSVQLVNDDADEDLDDHLEVGDVDYALQQFHFHAPSEHTVDGRHYPVEFHFVHASEDGRNAVIGVLAEVSPTDADNAAWAPFVDAVSTPDEPGVSRHLDLARLLPDSLEHWAYDGSLTTPPCTEGIHWMVLDQPIDLSQAQVDALDAAYVDNNRPVQARGDREVLLAAD